MAAIGVGAMIVQGGLVARIVTRFGERRGLIGGHLAGAAGFATYGLAQTGSSFMLGLPLQSLWGLAHPSSQALMPPRVGANGQGRLQGANASLRGIAGLIGPGLFTQTFARAIDGRGWHVPGAPFLLAAALLATAALVSAWATRRR